MHLVSRHEVYKNKQIDSNSNPDFDSGAGTAVCDLDGADRQRIEDFDWRAAVCARLHEYGCCEERLRWGCDVFRGVR
mgnify:CR=1 FL=1